MFSVGESGRCCTVAYKWPAVHTPRSWPGAESPYGALELAQPRFFRWIGRGVVKLARQGRLTTAEPLPALFGFVFAVANDVVQKRRSCYTQALNDQEHEGDAQWNLVDGFQTRCLRDTKDTSHGLRWEWTTRHNS
jgi:hypothetical protein